MSWHPDIKVLASILGDFSDSCDRKYYLVFSDNTFFLTNSIWPDRVLERERDGVIFEYTKDRAAEMGELLSEYRSRVTYCKMHDDAPANIEEMLRILQLQGLRT